MSAHDSRSEYASRMHRVLETIDRQLDQALDLETLAAVAHFSPFHFHRLFSAWMGETLGDYLRRRRVEVAAMRLAAQPRVAVLNVALSVGFGSAEAFARAFRARFGCSPSAWRIAQLAQRRSNGKLGQVDRKIGQVAALLSAQHGGSSTANAEIPMNVQLIDREPVTVAYLRHLGPYGEPIARFWQETYFPWAATHRLLESPRYGISHDDPGITAPDQCRYDAAVEVGADFAATGGAFKTNLPGGRYAVMRFKGNAAEVGDAWTALLRDWLPASGLQLDARPCFEHYPIDAVCDEKTGAFSCDICIPVVPL